MKKIIIPGRRETIVRRFTCTGCGCIFDSDEFSRVSNHNETYCVCSCPECRSAAYSVDQQ